MANLIDKTYFIRDLTIPNTGYSYISDNLDSFITKYQKLILVDALGYSLYSDFISGLALGTEKYEKIRDGDTYTFEYNGSTFTNEWPGFANSQKESLLAYWTYAYIIWNEYLNNTGVGVVRQKVDNAQLVDIRSKFVHAWNQGLDFYGELWQADEDEYFTYRGNVFFTNRVMEKNVFQRSLFNYIKAKNQENGDDYYPNWVFRTYQRLNQLEI